MAVAFLAAGAFFSVVFFSAVFFSVVFFSALGSAFLVAVAAAGLASFFASFTGPEVPMRRVSHNQVDWLHVYNKTRKRSCVDMRAGRGRGECLPLGRAKSPFSSPEVMARLTWLRKAASLRLPTLLLAWMYF